jgi:hypothetical protein
MTEKSPARLALEGALSTAHAATGTLALIVESGRGLTSSGVEELAGLLETAAAKLRGVLSDRKES